MVVSPTGWGCCEGCAPAPRHLLLSPCRAGRCDGDAVWGRRSSTGGGGAGRTPGEEGGSPSGSALGSSDAGELKPAGKSSRASCAEVPHSSTAARDGGKLPACPPTWLVLGRGGQQLCPPAGP